MLRIPGAFMNWRWVRSKNVDISLTIRANKLRAAVIIQVSGEATLQTGARLVRMLDVPSIVQLDDLTRCQFVRAVITLDSMDEGNDVFVAIPTQVGCQHFRARVGTRQVRGPQ